MTIIAATTNLDLVAAAEQVALACTPKRNLTLTDEFGPFRGRPFLDADVEINHAALAVVDEDITRLSDEALLNLNALLDGRPPRRNLTLTDEHGPFRGRPFLADEFIAGDHDQDDFGLSVRGDLAYELGC
jgi:hypothetical protein